jgi:hypothetical protein
MTLRASGSFEVTLVPLKSDASEEGHEIGRQTIDKRFSGDLDGTSRGEMMFAMSAAVQGSGAYVAIEWVKGRVQGRSGSFALCHVGTMARGTPGLTITVVPDSGTGELVGLAGTLAITITDGKHFYDFDYSLPEL